MHERDNAYKHVFKLTITASSTWQMSSIVNVNSAHFWPPPEQFHSGSALWNASISAGVGIAAVACRRLSPTDKLLNREQERVSTSSIVCVAFHWRAGLAGLLKQMKRKSTDNCCMGANQYANEWDKMLCRPNQNVLIASC